MNTTCNWDATAFFKALVATNRLAREKGFTFCSVSGLNGFQEALQHMQNTQNFVCVSDVAQGYTELDNSPHTRRVKTVFLAMRYPIDNMAQRQQRMDTMQELFRQLMSKLLLEKTRIEQNRIYLDSRISFNEIDEYFFSGCACTYFQIAVDVYTDLRLNEDEWEQPAPQT